jgi:hypothetical protein
MPVTPTLEEDLLIHTVMVQGGSVTVGDTAMPFVRIGMAGIPVDELGQGSRPVERVVGAVLNLDQADELASGLRSVMAHEPWGVAALANPARAIWRETSALSEGDMLVAGLGARITGGETIRLVRMDFTGIWLGGPTPDDQQLYTQGALFPDPVQLCSLISSVKKCVKAIRTASSTPARSRDEQASAGDGGTTATVERNEPAVTDEARL